MGPLEKVVQGLRQSRLRNAVDCYPKMTDNVQNISQGYERKLRSLKLLVRERTPSLFLYEYYLKYIRIRKDYEIINHT